jgi:hypothetical protein
MVKPVALSLRAICVGKGDPAEKAKPHEMTVVSRSLRRPLAYSTGSERRSLPSTELSEP